MISWIFACIMNSTSGVIIGLGNACAGLHSCEEQKKNEKETSPWLEVMMYLLAWPNSSRHLSLPLACRVHFTSSLNGRLQKTDPHIYVAPITIPAERILHIKEEYTPRNTKCCCCQHVQGASECLGACSYITKRNS